MTLSVESLFAPDGPVWQAVLETGATPTSRPVQIEYAAAVAEAIGAKSIAMLDAETGVGKTLGYLMPAMLQIATSRRSKPRLVIATATVALQKQLIGEDIPVATRAIEIATGVRLTAALRVGYGQIVDPGKLSHAGRDSARKDLVEAMVAWVEKQIGEGSLPLWSELSTHFAEDLLTRPDWLYQEACCLSAAEEASLDELEDLVCEMLRQAKMADIVVANQHLLGLHALRPYLWNDERPIILVVDEADRLERVMESLSRRLVPAWKLPSALKKIGAPSDAVQAVGALADALHAVGNHMESDRGVVPLHDLHPIERNRVADAAHLAAAAIETSIAVVKAPNNEEPGATDPDKLRLRDLIIDLERDGRQLAETAAAIRKGVHRETYVYVTDARKLPGLARIDTRGAGLIADRLWKQRSEGPGELIESIIFTSATLSTLAEDDDAAPQRALRPFYKGLGFRDDDLRQDACGLFAPVSFGSMAFVRPDPDAPIGYLSEGSEGSLNPDAVSYWASMVGAAAACQGRTLVLCASYTDLDALAAALGDLEGRLIAQTRSMGTQSAVHLFRARDDAVWLSASAWEGVSLPRLIKDIVIPRMPMRPRTFEDSMLEAWLANKGISENVQSARVFARQVSDCRRRLRQGIGRGIRSETDSVTIWIGDPRWPLDTETMDRELRDQPRPWSTLLLRSIPRRFRHSAFQGTVHRLDNRLVA